MWLLNIAGITTSHCNIVDLIVTPFALGELIYKPSSSNPSRRLRDHFKVLRTTYKSMNHSAPKCGFRLLSPHIRTSSSQMPLQLPMPCGNYAFSFVVFTLWLYGTGFIRRFMPDRIIEKIIHRRHLKTFLDV